MTGGKFYEKALVGHSGGGGPVGPGVSQRRFLAQGSGHLGGGDAVKGMASRVAGILGVAEETVQGAFNKAIRERQDKHVQSLLDRLVEAERLTGDEFDAAMGRYQARPDAAVYLSGVLLRGEEALQHWLVRMLEIKVITHEEADTVTGWPGAITVDLTTLQSDEDRRDRYLRTRSLQSGPFSQIPSRQRSS